MGNDMLSKITKDIEKNRKVWISTKYRGTPLLRLPEVLALMGISRATWYRGVKSGKYPKAVHPSERVSAWYLSELEALINGLRDVS